MIAAPAMTVHDHVVEATRRLESAGLAPDDARMDAEVLARAALGWDRTRLVLDRLTPPPAGFGALYRDWVVRRTRREPVAYITGSREFWGLDFTVTPAVLVPRPESELLVEHALQCLDPARRADARQTVADVGTGSGCLAVSLAVERPHLTVFATDFSPAALDVARRNAASHGVETRIEFRSGNLLDPVPVEPDLIVSNPPYVPASAVLSPDVAEYEPAAALFAGPDGLNVIRGLVDQAEVRLTRGGWLLFEFGDGQEPAVRRILERHPDLRLEGIVRDLQDIPRVAVARRT